MFCHAIELMSGNNMKQKNPVERYNKFSAGKKAPKTGSRVHGYKILFTVNFGDIDHAN